VSFPDWPADDDALLPAVVQDAGTLQVLMLAYMNRAAYEETCRGRRVTFFSRSRGRLWTKGETSGNTLSLVELAFDCDRDTLLVKALPAGPACHLDTTSCFGTETAPGPGFLAWLERVVAARVGADPESSYTARLLDAGLERIAQKVGEEGVETVVAALREDDAALAGEAADLLYHLVVLLQARGLELSDVVETLRDRHANAGQ
jgi:phosphoribosyl-ATP pyrophosphohydrolase/phosphoribosyl-AMP cyclohydrolase